MTVVGSAIEYGSLSFDVKCRAPVTATVIVDAVVLLHSPCPRVNTSRPLASPQLLLQLQATANDCFYRSPCRLRLFHSRATASDTSQLLCVSLLATSTVNPECMR